MMNMYSPTRDFIVDRLTKLSDPENRGYTLTLPNSILSSNLAEALANAYNNGKNQLPVSLEVTAEVDMVKISLESKLPNTKMDTIDFEGKED